MKIAQKGKSLRGFADEIGISQAYLSQLLNDGKEPSPTVAYKIATGLGVDVEEIFLVKMIGENNQKEVANE